jgi:hypothetical protein
MKSSLYSLKSDNMPIIRIAPVCNGKIYVIPHTSEEGTSVLDLPMVDHIEKASPQSEKTARKVKEKYHLHVKSEMQPRFSVQYKSASDNEETVYLYILPLKQEHEIQFHNGTFISADEINGLHYSANLQKESELIGMAAELWKDYFEGTPIDDEV